MRFKVYIPARYASSRLPGKPLLIVAGKPILQYVYENAIASGAEEVVIATDDNRIFETAAAFGAIVVATRDTHISGTDRIAEAATIRGEHDNTIVVNLQGDEPQLPPRVIEQVAKVLETHQGTDIASVCEPMGGLRDVQDPNVVKLVRSVHMQALYFSRSAIPYARDNDSISQYRRHVGIYAYRVGYLRRFVATPPGELEQIERLEQLRALAQGATITVPDAVAKCGIGVDTPEDYQRLSEYWDIGK